MKYNFVSVKFTVTLLGGWNRKIYVPVETLMLHKFSHSCTTDLYNKIIYIDCYNKFFATNHKSSNLFQQLIPRLSSQTLDHQIYKHRYSFDTAWKKLIKNHCYNENVDLTCCHVLVSDGLKWSSFWVNHPLDTPLDASDCAANFCGGFLTNPSNGRPRKCLIGIFIAFTITSDIKVTSASFTSILNFGWI